MGRLEKEEGMYRQIQEAVKWEEIERKVRG
jgi:hypothetical protein